MSPTSGTTDGAPPGGPRTPRLTVVTPVGLDLRQLQRGVARLAGAAGPRAGELCVLVRRPDLGAEALLALAGALAGPVRERGMRLGVNVGSHPRPGPTEGTRGEGRDWELERLVEGLERLGPDHLQLPEAASDVAFWRASVPSARTLGRSCHHPAGVTAAFAAGADMAWISPIFATPSKPGQPGLGLEALRTLCLLAVGPVVGLGGIDHRQAARCLASGAAGVACVRAAWQAEGEALVAACLGASEAPD